MPFLLSKNNASNLLIDKTGESIFYRHYPSKFNQRAIVIAKSTSNEYAASLDEYNNIHIIYKNSNNSLVHLYENNNKFDKKILLDDYNNAYQISNLKYIYYRKNYLFYCAHNPYEKTSDLIFHSFMQNEYTEPQSLISIPHLASPYECILYNDIIYLLCQLQNNGSYELNLYEYNINNSSWNEYETIVTSTTPFTSYSLCINNNTIHVTYEKIESSLNRIYYISNIKEKWETPLEIYSSISRLSPVIFTYNNIIWINFKENNQLKNSLSSNNGLSFTTPQLCSSQSKEARYYYFYGYKSNNLSGNKFYGYINKYPILAVLSQVDTDNILLSNNSNLEIKSIIENFTSTKTYNSITLKQEIEEQKEIQKNISTQYDNLAKMAKELQEQAKMWKSKFAKSEQENKKLKKKIRKAYVSSFNNTTATSSSNNVVKTADKQSNSNISATNTKNQGEDLI
ncbi:MAG: hypothetical protein N4A50_09065 [Vallitalea sp.]|jgi:hypothetical protein|nr:hypothetical protein [Vallitalea sp.]